MRFRSAFIILGAVGLLSGLALLPLEFRVGKLFQIKRVDLLAGIREPPLRPTVFSERAARAFRIARSIPTAKRRPKIPAVPDGAVVVQPLEMSKAGVLDPFFAALSRLRRGETPVRIAYFGDSIVEGDLITQDLRAALQRTFGGNGPGYLPITSEVASFRITVRHDFSSSWTTSSILQRKRPAPVGIAGLVFLPNCRREEGVEPLCEAWVEYGTTRLWPAFQEIQSLRLFYSGAEPPAAVEWTADDQPPQFLDLEPGEGVKEAVIRPETPARRLRLVVRGRNAFPVYGCSWENDGGIMLDNFALRGNSGLALTEIPGAMLRAFHRLLHYDLIILHFGVNVSSAETRDYSWYKAGMARVIAHFRSALPDTPILLISAGDRSTKDRADYVTIPTLPALVEAERQAAEEGGAAFWDLYGAMGGLNSMVAWVKHKPPLAALDYTHLSSAGSRRVADFLYNALLSRYKYYEQNHVR